MAITEAKSSMPASQQDGQDAGFNHTDTIQQLSFLSLVLPASLPGWTSQQPYTLAFERLPLLGAVPKAFLPTQDHLSLLGVRIQVPTVIVPSPSLLVLVVLTVGTTRVIPIICTPKLEQANSEER